MYMYDTVIKMHQVDAAGRLFFAQQFVIAHDAWEACLEDLGVSIASLLEQDDSVWPVVHADADYAAPISLGDRITVTVTCDRIGNRSFAMCYALSRGDDQPIGQVSVIHAVVAKTTGKAIAIPAPLRDLLQRIESAA